MTAAELILQIRKYFEEAISQKTGWGKNEILNKLDLAITKASLEALKDHITS